MPRTKQPIRNPALGIANEALKEMRAYAAELGLTPSSRARVVVPKDDPAGRNTKKTAAGRLLRRR